MFKPTLASPVDLETLKYPVYCSPKFDGIRCIIRGGVALSRTLKPIPNLSVRKLLTECPDNLDGELIIEGKTFNEIQSVIMSEEVISEFTFVVFDVIMEGEYLDRVEVLKEMKLPAFCRKVVPVELHNRVALEDYEKDCVEEWGFEGIMIRSGKGPYKFGRSTVKQGYLLKLKRFQDSEATIIGFVEMMHNTNEKVKDERGHSKRSSKKEGMVPAGVLGAFIVQTESGQKFNLATGLTAENRAEYWKIKDTMLGKSVKYKFQEEGAKNLPRFPVFIGIRHPDDM